MANLERALERLKPFETHPNNIDDAVNSAVSTKSNATARSVPPMPSKCTVCDQPSNFHCKACVDGHGTPDHNPTYYCGKECQTEHWKTHKVVCKKVQLTRQFHHAAELLLGIFYIQQERTLISRGVEKVVEEDGKLIVHEKNHPRPPEMKGQRISEEAFGNRRNKNAVLADMGCSGAVAWQVELVQHVLAGLTKSISEITFVPKNIKLEVRVKVGDKEVPRDTFDHVVLCITLRDGSKYAWDLSAAQYGWAEIIYPWYQYEKEKIFYISRIEDHGTLKKALLSMTSSKLYAFHMNQAHTLAQIILKFMVRFFDDIRIGDMASLLRKDHRTFEICNTWMLDFINLCIDDVFENGDQVCVHDTDE